MSEVSGSMLPAFVVSPYQRLMCWGSKKQERIEVPVKSWIG